METLDLETYLSNMKRRSYNTFQMNKTSIRNFDLFQKDQNKDIGEITNSPLSNLNAFVSWLESRNIAASTIHNYVYNVRKYLRMVHGIKTDLDEFKDFVVLPQVIEEDLEPLTKENLKLLIMNASNPRRRALYWFISSTGCRVAEALQIRKNMIDFTTYPPLVTIPAKITKGKQKMRYVYLTFENKDQIQQLCLNKKDNDLVFAKTENINQAVNNEEKGMQLLLKSLGLIEKYEHNGRYKIGFHAIRAFVSSSIYNKTRDAVYAHAYIGHGEYLKQYMRKSAKDRADMFIEIEKELIIFA